MRRGFLLRQTMDEVEYVGLATGILELFLRHLGDWLGSAEEDVEAHCSRVERRFL